MFYVFNLFESIYTHPGCGLDHLPLFGTNTQDEEL